MTLAAAYKAFPMLEAEEPFVLEFEWAPDEMMVSGRVVLQCSLWEFTVLPVRWHYKQYHQAEKIVILQN